MPHSHTEHDGSVRARLGVRAGTRVWVGGHSVTAKRALAPHLAGTTRPPTGPVERAFVTPVSVDEAVYFATKVRDRLVDDGILWVVRGGGAAGTTSEGSRDAGGLDTLLADAGWRAAGSIQLTDAVAAEGYRPLRP